MPQFHGVFPFLNRVALPQSCRIFLENSGLFFQPEPIRFGADLLERFVQPGCQDLVRHIRIQAQQHQFLFGGPGFADAALLSVAEFAAGMHQSLVGDVRESRASHREPPCSSAP
ncbi:hypothetical protein X922_06680 [Pseudomonas aeruginosa VRFPA08]|nr:hypothetical protein X922_06680 [Pseudomonas aeruginosa VRFPA08]